MRVLLLLVLAFMSPAVSKAEKPIADLIKDLGVEDKGNCTCNTACSELVKKKDEAVSALEQALRNPDERIRYYAVRTLGEIDTEKSRNALISATEKGMDDVRGHAAYALTWHPNSDAEDVYMESLSSNSDRSVVHAVQALGEIKSKKAAPQLKRMVEKPGSWQVYYSAVVALRNIEDRNLPEDLQEALAFLRSAKYSKDVDTERRAESEAVIRKNIEEVLPDVFNLYLWVTKGNESDVKPNAVTIIGDAGNLSRRCITIGLDDENENTSRRTKELVKRLSLEKVFNERL